MGPIGFLDSGVGGLTILDAVQHALPLYDTLYFGDSANAPYGNKDEKELYPLVEAGTKWLFAQGCPLVVYACNTASATVLRRIQQELVPQYPGHKVLGIVRPTIEEIIRLGHKNLLILATPATVASQAYEKELAKIDPSVKVTMHACPTWAPLVEKGQATSPYATQEVIRELKGAHAKTNDYDAVLLACTHYPYLSPIIEKHIRKEADLYNQGDLVANSLMSYLTRHPETKFHLLKQKRRRHVVTGNASAATALATGAFHTSVPFEQVDPRKIPPRA